MMKSILYFTLILLSSFTELCAQNTNQDVQLNGLRREYYPSGKLCKEFNVENGVPNGIVKSFNEKGFLISEQKFVMGVANGLLKTFFESGKVHYENNFEDGKPQGTSKEYFENGTLKINSYLTGEPWAYSGFTNIYYENGFLQSESKFSEGKLMVAITYDKEGRVTSEQKDGHSTSYWYEKDTGKRHVVIDGKPQD